MAKEKENKSNKKRVLIFSICALVFFIVVFLFAINANKFLYLQKSEIPVKVIVGNATAFNISKNDSILNLGTAKYGGDMERGFEISNAYPFPTKFAFEVEGPIKEILSYPKASYLRAEEDISVPFRTVIRPDTEFGEYTGVIKVTVTRFMGEFSESS